jgi:hypothetical protein
MLMAHSLEATLLLRDLVEALQHRFGLQRNPTKGLWEHTQVGDHMGLTTDLHNGFAGGVGRSSSTSPSRLRVSFCANSTPC